MCVYIHAIYTSVHAICMYCMCVRMYVCACMRVHVICMYVCVYVHTFIAYFYIEQCNRISRTRKKADG